MLSSSAYTALISLTTLALVALNACFVAAEFSLVKVRRTRLQELEKQGNKDAAVALQCANDLGVTLSSTQLGVTLASLGLGWIGQQAFSEMLHMISPASFPLSGIGGHLVGVVLSFFSITLIHVVLGELVPKSIAIQDAERVALRLAKPLRVFYKFSRPIIALFDYLSVLILGMLGYKTTKDGPLSEQELKMVMKESRREGVISSGEALIISRAFDFADKRACDIMVPREKVEFICTKRHVQDNLKLIKGRQHTRFPLCEGDFDHVIGVVRTKDIWPHLLENLSNDHFHTKRRDPLFVSHHIRQDHLLQLFQMRQAHQAIVRDESGRNIGIVTLEDVIEQVVGFFPH